MAINDLTADMLTRIRNAVRNREKSITCISNKLPHAQWDQFQFC